MGAPGDADDRSGITIHGSVGEYTGLLRRDTLITQDIHADGAGRRLRLRPMTGSTTGVKASNGGILVLMVDNAGKMLVLDARTGHLNFGNRGSRGDDQAGRRKRLNVTGGLMGDGGGASPFGSTLSYGTGWC